jgi:hypothetical protein
VENLNGSTSKARVSGIDRILLPQPGLAWLESQAEVAEDLIAERQVAASGTADVAVAHDGRCRVKANWRPPWLGTMPPEPAHAAGGWTVRDRGCPLFAGHLWPQCGPAPATCWLGPVDRGRLRRSGPPRPGTDRPAGHGKADAGAEPNRRLRVGLVVDLGGGGVALDRLDAP